MAKAETNNWAGDALRLSRKRVSDLLERSSHLYTVGECAEISDLEPLIGKQLLGMVLEVVNPRSVEREQDKPTKRRVKVTDGECNAFINLTGKLADSFAFKKGERIVIKNLVCHYTQWSGCRQFSQTESTIIESTKKPLLAHKPEKPTKKRKKEANLDL